METPVGMGGQGMLPNPIQYLIGSLGGCVGVKILLALSDNGIIPDGLTIAIHGTRVKTMPAFFDHIHLNITLKADADNGIERIILEICYDDPADIGAQTVNYVFDQIMGQRPRRPAFLKPQGNRAPLKMAHPDLQQPSGQFILENNLVLSGLDVRGYALYNDFEKITHWLLQLQGLWQQAVLDWVDERP